MRGLRKTYIAPEAADINSFGGSNFELCANSAKSVLKLFTITYIERLGVDGKGMAKSYGRNAHAVACSRKPKSHFEASVVVCICGIIYALLDQTVVVD